MRERVDVVLEFLRHLRQPVIVICCNRAFVAVQSDDPFVVLHDIAAQLKHDTRIINQRHIRLHRLAINRRAARRCRAGDGEFHRERRRTAHRQHVVVADRGVCVRNRRQETDCHVRNAGRSGKERILHAVEHNDPPLTHHRRAGQRDVCREEIHRRLVRFLRHHAERDVTCRLDELRDTAQGETVGVFNLQRVPHHRRRVTRRQQRFQSLRHLRQRGVRGFYRVGVVAIAEVQCPDISGLNRSIQCQSDAREIVFCILGARELQQRRRIQHGRRDLELEHVERAVT